MKIYTDKNVYDAAIERIEYIFNEFDHVYFSVSGGKDSSFMLQLANKIALKTGRKFDVFFIDQEAIYEYTSRLIEELKLLPSIDEFYHICLPFYEDNAVSVFQTQWMMWDEQQRDKWVREKTEKPYNNIKFWGKYWDDNPDIFMEKFSRWYKEQKGGKVAAGVGIRTDESYHRFRAVAFGKNIYKNKMWTTQISRDVYNFYPIYDFSTEDVWAGTFKNNFKFNEFYELAYKSGLSIHEARICQPYGHQQKQGLNQYARFEPETWQKVVNRVSGANFGNVYCKSSLLGHNGSCKPDHMNWEEYAVFLLESLGLYCPELMLHYHRKIKILMEYYKDTENKEVIEWIDTAKPKEVKKDPQKWYNWRRIALAIEKNDFELRSCQYGLTRVDESELIDISQKYGKLLGIENKKTKTYLKYQDML
ncbi:MAG: DUF3440 domain-containing protein [Prolixibacteraceae bacterium]